MLKSFTKFIDGLGDWNHVAIAIISMLANSLLGWFIGYDPNPLNWDLAKLWSAFYFSKEYHSYQPKLGYIRAFTMNIWSRHDRRQTILLWCSVWAFAFIFDKFIYNLIN